MTTTPTWTCQCLSEGEIGRSLLTSLLLLSFRAQETGSALLSGRGMYACYSNANVLQTQTLASVNQEDAFTLALRFLAMVTIGRGGRACCLAQSTDVAYSMKPVTNATSKTCQEGSVSCITQAVP